MIRKGICRDLYEEGCSLKDQIQEVYEDNEFVCKECGDLLYDVPKPFSEKILKKLLSVIGLGVLGALLLMGGGVYWYMQPDVTAPDKPVLLSKDVTKTHTDHTDLKIEGESGSSIYLNSELLNQKIDDDGEATITIDTSYDIGIIKAFSIYLQDDSNNSSELFEIDIEKVDTPDTEAPDSPTIDRIPVVMIDDNGDKSVQTVLKIGGEEGSKVFLNGEDTHKVISNDGVAMVSVNVTLENIDNEFSLTLRDDSGNESTPYTFKFEKNVKDTTAPDKPTIILLPTKTTQESVMVEINGENQARIFVNGNFIGEHIEDGKREIELDTSGKVGKKEFSIYLQDRASNSSEPLKFFIMKEEDKDETAPEKPKILSSTPSEYHCEDYNLELEGEVGSDIYINGKHEGIIETSGRATLNINLQNQNDFEITLKDRAKNESSATHLSIRKSPLPQNKSVKGRTFVYVPNCRQEIKYQIEPYLRYGSDKSKSIYTQDEIETDKPFYIESVPVTISQFRQFVDETNYAPEGLKNKKAWDKDENGETNSNYPVTNVSLNDIEQYIAWFNQKTGQKYRLPTVKEWIITINQNLRDNDDYVLRPKVDPAEQEVRYFISSLYEYSSTPCDTGSGVMLLAGDYVTDVEQLGKKQCEDKLHQFVTFRLVQETD